MTKSQLIAEMAAQAGLTKTAAEKALDALTGIILETLATGESVHLDRIGKLSVVARPERAGRNPRTGEALTLPASNTVKFSPSKYVKDAVNG